MSNECDICSVTGKRNIVIRQQRDSDRPKNNHKSIEAVISRRDHARVAFTQRGKKLQRMKEMPAVSRSSLSQENIDTLKFLRSVLVVLHYRLYRAET